MIHNIIIMYIYTMYLLMLEEWGGDHQKILFPACSLNTLRHSAGATMVLGGGGGGGTPWMHAKPHTLKLIQQARRMHTKTVTCPV